MKLKLLIAMTVLVAGTAQAKIEFKGGWDSAENSDAGVYTQNAVTEFLKNKSEDLRKIIEGPAACVLEVTKGCHQPNDPHFTVNGLKSTDKCKVTSIYVGSKSDHSVGC